MAMEPEPAYVNPGEIEYFLTHLLQPLVVKLTDLETKVDVMSAQLAEFKTLVDGLKTGTIAKRLLGVG